jgi:uncharacterized protein (UPF0261 family)
VTGRTGIWLIGTLDTKREAIEYLAEEIRAHGQRPIVVDVSLAELTSPSGRDSSAADTSAADISAADVVTAGGVDPADLQGMSRSAAMEHMMTGAAATLLEGHRRGEVRSVIAVGGSGGTAIASHAMRGLPIGLPKLIVSTVAAGDMRQYVGSSDIGMQSSVVDIMGLNSILERVLRNAAAAIVGMAENRAGTHSSGRRVIALTSFGVTTPCVQRCRALLEARDFEVLVFHARGSGGKAMEDLVRAGEIHAVLDVTTTELADEVAGGMMSAGPDRLDAAAAAGIPQVVVPGALDVVNFGSPDHIPAALRSRLLHAHNPNNIVMRTSAEELASVGRLMARKLNRASAPVEVLIPARGFSDYDREGGVFFDPAADGEFEAALRADLRPGVDVTSVDAHINVEPFADHCVERLLALLERHSTPAP